ncbi:MAG TPA: Xaa-Pro peptidase family protein [Bryobacteraceae bacterium]|nr:Xaa-Pro peptidase family protein [Bryobacteraceae bacterium]
MSTNGAPIDVYAERRARIAEGLAERKLDALLVAFSPNLRYLTGFTGSNGNALITSDRSILFTDPRYTTQAEIEAGASSEVRIANGPLAGPVLAAIGRLRLARIGYEPARMTCDVFDALHSRLPSRATLVPVLDSAEGWIEELRAVKSPDEIDRIRKSVLTNSRAFEYAAARVKPGMKESDLAAELEYRMRRFGAEKPSFETIVAGGARSAWPHAQPTGNKLQTGELTIVDMGAMQDGYASDMTRMLFLGNPSPKVKRMYRAVLEAQMAAVAAVRAGVKASAVDAAARNVLEAHGLADKFIHSTGHGLGLEIHEPPRIGKRGKAKLQAGMAITIEPGVYLEGFGGIRIEDTVIVTETGCEVLTPTSKELRVI